MRCITRSRVCARANGFERFSREQVINNIAAMHVTSRPVPGIIGVRMVHAAESPALISDTAGTWRIVFQSDKYWFGREKGWRNSDPDSTRFYTLMPRSWESAGETDIYLILSRNLR